MSKTISIVGAGLSGLAAAITLEKAGFTPVIYEASDRVGGRVKTDLLDGYQLDHGFQVLLDAYPKAQQYFDYDGLQLQRILPGTVLFRKGKSKTIGDPSRHFGFIFPTISSGVAGIKDMFLLWSLHIKLQKTPDQDLFKEEEISTITYLKKKGFSDRIIELFFRPFFSGIFLENELKTSCRMFLFVLKMFGKGYATIPKAGMGELAQQLADRLQQTTINFNTPVVKLEEGKILLKDGKEIASDAILLAADASFLIDDKKQEPVSWQSCDTLYFKTRERRIEKNIIGLVTDPDALINNIFYPTSINCRSRGAHELLSVTVVRKHGLSKDELIKKVTLELKAHCDIADVIFLKHYYIPKALPSLNGLNYLWNEEKGRLGRSVFKAGDQLLYGSSNAALLSGEMAATAMIAYLRK
jgi:protoporphyrinogen oxidase